MVVVEDMTKLTLKDLWKEVMTGDAEMLRSQEDNWRIEHWLFLHNR